MILYVCCTHDSVALGECLGLCCCAYGITSLPDKYCVLHSVLVEPLRSRPSDSYVCSIVVRYSPVDSGETVPRTFLTGFLLILQKETLNILGVSHSTVLMETVVVVMLTIRVWQRTDHRIR